MADMDPLAQELRNELERNENSDITLVTKTNLNDRKIEEMRDATLSPGARIQDTKESHIVPEDSDEEDDIKSVDELKEIVTQDGYFMRAIEYIVEKINDFTDYMGCTDSDNV